jgi:hypothetical protein
MLVNYHYLLGSFFENTKWNLGARAPSYQKFKIYYFEVLENFEKIYARIYYVDTLSCKYSRRNTIVCDVHKNKKMKLLFL